MNERQDCGEKCGQGLSSSVLDAPQILTADPAELPETAEGLIERVKAQAPKIAKLEHQIAGHNRHRFEPKSETMEQLQLTLDEEETAAAHEVPEATPNEVDEEYMAKPKRKPLPLELLSLE